MIRMSVRPTAAVSLLALMAALPAAAQDRNIRYSMYGTPGLIEMPTALSAPDGQIAANLSLMDGQHRVNLTFQVTPRLSGTFRYAGVDDYRLAGETFYDRSFDLRYQLTDEGDLMPAIAVGLQDFLGTGLYQSEYLVATKTLSDSVRVTGGIGWGRMGTYNGFSNPLGAISDYFDTRPVVYEVGDTGGTVAYEAFFRGPAAFFGGVEWAVTDAFMIKAEYSSDDAYRDINGTPLFDRVTPLNVGLSWRPRPGYQLDLAYLNGSQIALSGTITLNPNERPFLSGLDSPPRPVALRPGDAAAAASWDAALNQAGPLDQRLAQALAAEGIVLDSLSVDGRTIRVRYANTRFRTESQAMGRVARVLSAQLPTGIDTIVLEPMQRGLPLSSFTLSRSAIERLENTAGGAEALLNAAGVTAAPLDAPRDDVPDPRSPFSWGLTPYLAFLVFDGDNPVRTDFGLNLTAEYQIAPNLIASGRLRYSLVGSDDPGAISPSTLPPVRRNMGFYRMEGNPGIENLQLAWYGHVAPDVYARATVGYLEMMFGGASAELLWKPVDSRLGVGVEVSHVWQRDFDMLLGFQDYQVTTGHVSAYYDFDNGFHGQVDLGRYLAGDWGATFSVDREFENGWRIGGYFTLTDASAEEFGEGSFDKGIRLTVPFDYLLGQPSQREINNTLASLTRDGGARLNIQGRLYDTVRGGHMADISDSWGRFWR